MKGLDQDHWAEASGQDRVCASFRYRSSAAKSSCSALVDANSRPLWQPGLEVCQGSTIDTRYVTSRIKELAQTFTTGFYSKIWGRGSLPSGLVVPVPEEHVSGIMNGASVPFQVPAWPERAYSGTIARISHALDQKTRTMAIELDVFNRYGSLAPGMYPTVKWPVQRLRPSLFVPKTSVVTTTERTFVMKKAHHDYSREVAVGSTGRAGATLMYSGLYHRQVPTVRLQLLRPSWTTARRLRRRLALPCVSVAMSSGPRISGSPSRKARPRVLGLKG